MKSLFTLLLAGLLSCAPIGFAAPAASLSGNKTRLSPNGGTVTLTASSTYDANPAALGWEIALPDDWFLVGVAGASVPDIVPAKGATGTIGFVYVNIPAGKAEFTLEVAYPANSAGAALESNVILRDDGNLTTLRPAPLIIAASAARGRNAALD